MASYAHLENATNKVLAVVEWDGISEVPIADRPVDTSLILVDGTDPWVGDVWNGTVYVHTEDSVDPGEPPADSGGMAGDPVGA